MAVIDVDNIFEEKETGTVILWLRQPEPWDTPGLMSTLQDRLNGYISVIRDGWLVQKFPHYQNKRTGISLVCYEFPPDDVKLKLDRVHHTLLQIGIEFRIVLIQVETPQPGEFKRRIGAFLNRLRGKK